MMIIDPCEQMPFQLVETDKTGRIWRIAGAFDNPDVAKREAKIRNTSRSWRPAPTRWWRVDGCPT